MSVAPPDPTRSPEGVPTSRSPEARGRTGSYPPPPERGAELARRFLDEAQGGVLGHPLVATLTLVLFWGRGVAPFSACIWYGILLLATGGRILAGRRALREKVDPGRGQRLVFYGVAAVASAWALGGILFGTRLPLDELGILLVIMAGLVAAGATTLAAHPPSFLVFSSAILGSVFVSVLLRLVSPVGGTVEHLRLHLLLLLLVAAFWAVMAVLHRRSHTQLLRYLESQSSLARAEEEYRELVESARDLVWRVDMEGRWTFLNSSSREIYGAPPGALLGEVALDRADEGHLEGDYAAFGRILMGGELIDHETVHRTVGGETRYLSFSARPIRGPGGEVLGAQGTARDVTDRVRARQALEELLQKSSLVRSLIDATADLIFYKDQEGVYQGCNSAFCAFMGLSEGEIVGRTDARLLGEERAAAYGRSDREALLGAEPVRTEEWVERPGEGRRLMETLKTAYRTPQGHRLGLLGIVRDVTERKEAEERMRELAERAEHATRMKSSFLANMSHEIRTPMNGILGMTEILLDSDLSEDQRQSLEIVRSSGEALLEILNDILDLSKIEAGHLELEEIPFDLHEVVAGAAQLFSIAAAGRRNELVLDIRPQVPQGVRGDLTRLRQVLSNLIGNAVKFTTEGEILVSADLDGRGESGARVRFSVKDSGVGILPEKQKAIFQEFTQADSSTSRQYGGTGLGLAISRHLVGLMGGDLSVRSEVGRGSEFHFCLELPEEEKFEPARIPLDPGDLGGLRALVVDDNPTNRRIFREFMEGTGARVEVAPGAEEALRHLREAQEKDPFGLALLDVVMPGKDGFQLAEDIRRDPALGDLRLMILTSTSRPGDRRLATRLGVESFLIKPVSRRDLLRALAAVLEVGGDGEPTSPEAFRSLARPGSSDEPEGRRSRGQAGPSGIRILVAEDNPVNQQVAVALLERWGHGVKVVVNGLEVLEALREGPFDLVLMDVQMPEMDGVEATRRIRNDPELARVPILAVTAHALQEERDRCLAAGMDDYLSKPFKPEDLDRKVLQWAGGLGGPAPGAGVARAHGEGGQPPPVFLDLFRRTMREAGIESVVDSVISTYLAELPGRLTALEAAVAEGELERVRSEAHALKSGSRNIRAEILGDLLESMEEAGRAGRAEEAGAILPRLRREVEAVVDHLTEKGYSPS